MRFGGFFLAASKYRKLAEDVLDAREKSPPSEDELFVDVLLASDETKESKIDNATTFITGGFHTTANCKDSFKIHGIFN